MKRVLFISLLGLFLFNTTVVFAIKPTISDLKNSESSVELSLKTEKKVAKRKAKLEKRLGKMEQKIKKRALRGEAAESDMWDDSRFKLGALLVLGAIGMGLLGALGILSGLFNFVAGLLALAGIILVIWSLVDY